LNGTIRKLLRKINVKSLERHQATKPKMEDVMATEAGSLAEAPSDGAKILARKI
jgi:hypothetical protein